MSEVLAIALDVDGTLLSSQGRLSPATLAALRCCAENGILLYLATARPRRLIFRDSEVEGNAAFLQVRGAFYNGATAFDDSIGLRAHWPIPADIVSGVVGVLEEFAADIQIALQFEERHHSFRLPISDSELRAWGFAREDLVPFQQAMAWDCSKIVAFHESRGLADAYDQVTNTLGEELSVFPSDTGNWIQVMSRHASKEGALAYLLEARGIATDRKSVV